MVRHKTIHSCESAIYFDLNTEIIKQNCDFLFYYNKTDITPAVLDSSNKIILANWPADKHIIFSINNDFPIEIPSHQYILVNTSVLCNCSIEVENNYLLESLAACHDSRTKLVMYFTVNLAFTNYTNDFNLTEEINIPTFTNKSTSEVTLPVVMNKSKFDESLLSAPLTLKEYISQYKCDKEMFGLKERHNIDELEKEFANKNFFNSKIIKIFKFMVAIISIIATVIIIYAICKHNKLRALVTSLVLQQVKEVKAENKENVDYSCECTIQLYIILILSIVMIGLIVFAILQLRRIKLCRSQLFSNIVKIMLFISDIQYYIPVKLCKTAGSIHLFRITGKITMDKVKLKKHYVWDILEIDWSEVKVTINGKVTILPKSIMIKMWDKFKIRQMMGNQPLPFHLMLKQGFNWFMLTQESPETEEI